ncbi:amidase domain-containing protein [Coprothermobacter proteolyticus]|uniref:amidase domain-containing protein n=1 Tax=Coprothermobacter proteolyticus TaxID=35786 RepID=UPI001F3D7424|nr:amidase domain-containing protein [Coprothermobacter proteolyticus]
MLVTVTILALILTGMFALSFKKPVAAKAEVSQEQLQQLLNQALLIYLKATSTYMDISEQTVTLADFNSDSLPIEAIFDVSQTFVANFKTPDDDPMLAGKIKWLENNRAKLTPNEISVAEVLINQTRKQVQESMTEPFTGYSNWKITADSAEDAISGNFKVYLWTVLEHKLAGEIKNWEITDSLLPQITEEEVYKTFGDTVKAATHAHQIFLENMKEQENTETETQTLIGITAQGFQYNYNAAANYANTYTSNTTRTVTCQDQRTGKKISVRHDPSYYNTSEYSYYACGDCANYVSQSLHAGGIPTDSFWYPGSEKWVSATNMRNYMLGEGYAYRSQVADKGGFIGYGDTSSSTATLYHVLVVVQVSSGNVYVSAHTNDVKNVLFSGAPSPLITQYYSIYPNPYQG